MSNQKSKNIHWYPGHMAKAMKELEAKINFVDVIVELLDARAPHSSRNPELAKRGLNKKRLIVLTKKDLADPHKLNEWIKAYEEDGHHVLALNLLEQKAPELIINELLKLGEEKWERNRQRGLKPQPIRALVTGIPNVGKSTLINTLAGKKSAKVANKPGLTRAQQYIKISSQLEFIDTPGILPPNYEDKQTALHLAMIGTIPADILPLHEIVEEILNHVRQETPTALFNRYKIEITEQTSNFEILKLISFARGFQGGENDNYEQAEKVIHREFASGLIGKYTLEVAYAFK